MSQTCTYAGCEEVATRVMAQALGAVKCHYAAPYCGEHADDIAAAGGLPVAGPALSDEAQKIGGIR